MHPAAQATIDDLPDQLLGSVLVLAGRACGPKAALVCRRWHGVLYSSDAADMWRSLRIDATILATSLATMAEQRDWVHARIATLQRVGPMAASFFVREVNGSLAAAAARWVSPGWHLGSLLDSLAPAVLSDLGIACNPFSLPPAVVQRLGAGFPCLSALQLTTMQLPGAVAQALSCLGQLRSLRCVVMQMPEELLPAVCQLNQLTRIEMESVSVSLPSGVAGLTALRHLQHLQLRCHEPDPGELQPLLERAARPSREAPSPCDFPALTSYDVSVAGGFQMAGAHLNSCSFRLEPPPPDGPLCLLGRPMGRLTVGQASRLQREDGLHALLEALLPPGALLDVLQLEHCQLSPPGTLQGVALLARPSALHLHYCKEGDQGGLGQAALQAILGQASGCCALELYGRLGSEGAPGATTLPPALANTRGVKWLCLRRNYLEDLPKGPWLADLEVLKLGDINFAISKALPPALFGAPALRRLCLATNSKVQVRKPEIELLLSMPRLEYLSLGVRMAPGVRKALQAAAPQLQLVQP